MIYLDNAATTMIIPQVLEVMMPYLQGEYGNAGAVYGFGRHAAEAIKAAREQVAGFIGAEPEQIIFTSGGTEANNLAILGCREHMESVGKKHVVTTPTEHDSVLRAARALCGSSAHNNPEEYITNEFHTSFLPVNKFGIVSTNDLRKRLDLCKDVGLVSVMYANNEIGTFNNIVHIGRICKEKCILFHTDCVQAAGNVPLDVREIGCDFMSISAHKIHGPKGVGALYVRDARYIQPIINGGHEQEFGLRGGTEAVAGIVGFGKACELAQKNMGECNETISLCKKLFWEILKIKLYSKGIEGCVSINGATPNCEGKVMSITAKGVDAETLVLMMDTKGVCVSAGSACRSHESKPSHVLKAIGMSDDDARSTIRISFSGLNTTYEVETAAEIMAECIDILRGELI